MNEAVEFTPYVRPACLNSLNNPGNSKAIATGFGKLNYGNYTSRIFFLLKNFQQREREIATTNTKSERSVRNFSRVVALKLLIITCFRSLLFK